MAGQNTHSKRFLIWVGFSVTVIQTGAGTARANDELAGGTRRSTRVTLEQVKQAADPIASPLGRLGQLSIEAAKQHRLSVQADYLPKFGAAAANLHFTDFLGQLVIVRRPVAGTIQQVAVPIFSQNQMIAALTFTQPITPYSWCIKQ